MIIIKSMTINSTFRYLWLKSVHDVDLNQHCAKCLIGEYSKAIDNRHKYFNDIELPNDVYYLCGVSLPYNWFKNFHLAFKYSEGDVLEYSNNGISITIQNAVKLPISEEYIDDTDKHAFTKSYRTCRNWQFAHYFKKHLC